MMPLSITMSVKLKPRYIYTVNKWIITHYNLAVSKYKCLLMYLRNGRQYSQNSCDIVKYVFIEVKCYNVFPTKVSLSVEFMSGYLITAYTIK